MITYPNAKINIGLNIVGKRPDGYHNLETIFYPIPLCDTLSVETGFEPHKDSVAEYKLHIDGNQVDCEPEKNLVIKAYRLMQKDYLLQPIQINMTKNIPSGAGLGGGSADAAFMLKMLNECHALNLDTAQLEEYASKLGADCAFFIQNKPTLAHGIGNVFSPVELVLKGYKVVLVKPDIHISTQEAYAHVTPHTPENHLQDTIKLPIEQWKEFIVNDFEESIFPNHPELKHIKEELYKQGALYASMSGSGSTIYGIFPKETCIDANYFKPHFTWQSILEI